MIEIRWHARAGQGAKTAAQVFALAMLREGRSVQAFPEYGPERRGAPVRAYVRVDDRPIRRHDAIDRPDMVVVLEESLLAGAVDGLEASGVLIANTTLTEAQVRGTTGFQGRTFCVDADGLAASVGARFANEVVLGAVAAVLGAPQTERLVEAQREVLGAKADPATAHTVIALGREAIAKGEAQWAA